MWTEITRAQHTHKGFAAAKRFEAQGLVGSDRTQFWDQKGSGSIRRSAWHVARSGAVRTLRLWLSTTSTQKQTLFIVSANNPLAHKQKCRDKIIK